MRAAVSRSRPLRRRSGAAECRSTHPAGGYDRRLRPERLHFTSSDAANELIARDPMALLVGFALDQQVTVPKAFAGPLALKERLGSLDPSTLAAADLEPVFRQRPAIHRYPRVMAGRVHDLAVHVLEEYDGDAARAWTAAEDSAALRRNLHALPGFGEMKVASLAAVLARRYGVATAEAVSPAHPTLADVDSAAALAEYQALKRAHRKDWDAIRAAERARPQ
ncbi:MAG: HhH-GPD-type base excision DNA repair protein [Solirubrobacteraceae bacterium]